MPIDLQLLGSKLYALRGQRELSIQEVSDGTGIPALRVEKFERGITEPTGDEILIFSDFYKCDYKVLISNESVKLFERMDKFYRTHGDDFSKEDRKAIQEFLFLCECEEFLMEYIPLRNKIDFSFVKLGNYHKGHGIDAAMELRGALGFHGTKLPGDVYYEFRRLGVHIFRRRLGNSNISGLYIKHPNTGKCILVNYDEDVYRQRFTIAHEVGHAILDDDKDFNISHKKYSKKDLTEIRANAFASEFLVPGEVAKYIDGLHIRWDNEKVIEWANRLRINPEVLGNALSDKVDIKSHVKDFIKSQKIPREEKSDPELPQSLSENFRNNKLRLLELGLSSFYVDMCFEAYENNYITFGRLAEILLCTEFELHEIAKIFNKKLKHGDRYN